MKFGKQNNFKYYKIRMLWYYNRWIPMVHPIEEIYRLKQFIQNSIIDRIISYYYNIMFSNKFDKLKIKSNREILNVSLVQFETKNIDKSIYEFYKCKINLNEKINWRYDYKNKIESPIKLHSKIDKNSFKEVGELKYALEPSRFNFLPFFALAFLEKDEITYSPIQHIRDWSVSNPYLLSFNWKDGIEVGIRSINICYAYSLLNEYTSLLTEEDKHFISNLLYLHFNFLKNHLSKYSSSNNHFISELIGIYTITSFFSFKSSYKWRKYALHQLIKEFPNQFHKDGFSAEQSTCYHKDVLSQYSIFISLAQNRDSAYLSDNFMDSVKKAYEALIAFRICKNTYFQVGDNDNSLIMNDYTDPNYSEYESVINDYSIIFSKKYFNKPDKRNLLIWSSDKLNKYSVQCFNDTFSQDKFLKDSGYFIHKGKYFSTIFDFGNLGFKYAAAHGHSDMLSFQLYVGNIPFFIDMGTYQYHEKDILWRNYFRGIHSHNTVAINNEHHSSILSSMIWNPISSARLLNYSFETNDSFCESDFKYSNNSKHNRVFTIKRDTEISIIDTISANQSSDFSIYFHLHPDCTINTVGNNIYEINNNDKRIILDISGEYFRNTIIDGNKILPLGWYSPSYDKIEPTKVIRIEGIINTINVIKTKIKIII